MTTTTTTGRTRAGNKRLREILADVEIDPGQNEIEPTDSGCYLLIESGRFNETCYTLWDSPEEAADYNTNQEYAEDWSDCALIDLDTGDEFTPTHTITWERRDVHSNPTI